MEIGLRLFPVVELQQVVCSVELDNLDKKFFLHSEILYYIKFKRITKSKIEHRDLLNS